MVQNWSIAGKTVLIYGMFSVHNCFIIRIKIDIRSVQGSKVPYTWDTALIYGVFRVQNWSIIGIKN
jgi:hypothetical protein